jgi:polysaccharide export outer membrane protein
MRTHARWPGVLLAGLTALAGGCFHTQGVVIPPPPDGSVPTELNPVVLPRYVIAPPDILYVQVLQAPETYFLPRVKPEEYKATDPALEARKYFSNPLTPAPIDGQHVVQMDGTIDLGIYGSVQVAGLTTDQARERVRAFILQLTNRKEDQIQVRVSVLAFNSKQYYVITDGAGNGQQVAAFPITGSETVLDAMARIGGLPVVSSKRDIWVARRSPHGGPEQILPVCWEEITEQGIARTNYQVLPGDRIYVKAQSIVTIDNWLAKVLQPIERVLGVTLLGSETVNSIRNRNGNGTGTGTGG